MTAAGDRPVLTDGRLRIRPGQPGDAARLRAILAEPSVALAHRHAGAGSRDGVIP